MSPDLSWSHFLVRQERCERALKNVGVAADSMRSVAVVGALAVETQVVGRRHEECLEELSVREGVQFGGHVEDSASHWHRAPETKQPAEHNASHC